MFEEGLTWLRADFHLHTVKDKEFRYDGAQNDFVNQYVSALKTQNISVGVITNHNKFDFDEYRAIRKKARKSDILILPGVELTVKEGANGIHVLIVFDPDAWISNGENFINSFLVAAFEGISTSEMSRNTRCNYDLKHTLEALDTYDRDYFVIFAHVDQNSGLFAECDGGMLESLTRLAPFKKRVLGLQKSRTHDKLDNFCKTAGYMPALVEGSDPKSISAIGTGEKSCYLKIGELSFAAVKFSLLDSGNRVSRNLSTSNHGWIESIHFSGGKLDGTTINLSNGLNTMIGIRGSGKSSIIEVIRYAFGLYAGTDKEYKENLVKNTLGSGGEISVFVRNKLDKRYEIRRILNEKATIFDDTGSALGVTADSIIKLPLYFGQKDLSQSSYDEAILLEKIVSGKVKDYTRELKEYEEFIADTIRSIINFASIPEEITEAETRKNNLEYRLKIFTERGIAEKLKKQAEYNKDKQILDNLIRDLEADILNIRKVREKAEVRYDELDNYESEYNSEVFDEAKKILHELEQIVSNIDIAISQFEECLEKLKRERERLCDKIGSMKEEFAQIRQQIDDPDLDIEDFPKLKSQIDKVSNEIKKLRQKEKSRDDLEAKLKNAISVRNELLRSEFKEYEEEICKINDSQSDLMVKIEFKGDKEKFKAYLREQFKGTGISESKYQKIADQFSDFVALIEDCVLEDGKSLKTILTATEYQKLYSKIETGFAAMIALKTPNMVGIIYHGKDLRKHSLGQRSSAIVLFILTQEDNDVVIIDQPEDDLDNKVIYDEVIKEIRNVKRDTQFIFATHNANIPVLGDAEKVIVAEYKDDAIVVSQGNIDADETHIQIVDIMEGGQDAFRRRQMIYNSWEQNKTS